MTRVRLAACLCAALSAAPTATAVTLAANRSELLASGNLMRREQSAADFVVDNPAETSRRYSSIWSNDAIGTAHARGMLDSPQAWSSAANNKDQWMVLDLGVQKAVNGCYFQARNPGSCCGNQIVTDVHFEYSKDCVEYTPVELNRVFKTGVVADSPTKFLVSWQKARVAKCVKIWVDGWQNHISMRAGASTRVPEAVDTEVTEFMVENPAETSRKYSSVSGNDAIGTNHARSRLDGPQGWSAIANDKNQWMSIELNNIYNVRGVYFQGRNKGSCCGDQFVTQAWFEVSRDCQEWFPVEDGRVFPTNVVANEEVKRLVEWKTPRLAKCVKILVDSWSVHISMRAGLSAVLVPFTGGVAAYLHQSTLLHAPASSGNSSAPQLPGLSGSIAASSFYGDGAPTHVDKDFEPIAQDFATYGDGMPTHVG